MDRDLTMMIYGAILGVTSSLVTSLVTSFFQYWLARQEYERRQREEESKQLRHIYLPTGSEVIVINSQHRGENELDAPRSPAQTGSIVLSVAVSGFLVYRTNNPSLSLAFAALLGYLLTNRIIRLFKR
jgi:hypothetical protein